MTDYNKYPESVIRSYTNATIAAVDTGISPPLGYPWLTGALYRGVTAYQCEISFAASSARSIDIPGQDIAVETAAMQQTEDPFIPIQVRMQPGERISINPLTAGVEARLYLRFSRQALNGGSNRLMKRYTFTNTGAEPLALTPASLDADLRSVLGYYLRGIDLEGVEVKFDNLSTWLIARDVTALADDQEPISVVPLKISEVGGMSPVLAVIHHGTGGASDLYILYSV